MGNPLTPDQQNAVLEDALYTYPLASLPRTVTPNVMARIRTIPVPQPFHLTWQDLVLALIFAACIGAVWFSINNLPPLVVAQTRKESILLYQYLLVNMRWLIPLLSFGLAAFLSALTVPYLRRELLK